MGDAKNPERLVFQMNPKQMIIDLLWWLRGGDCWPWCDDAADGGDQYPPADGWTDEYDGWC